MRPRGHLRHRSPSHRPHVQPPARSREHRRGALGRTQRPRASTARVGRRGPDQPPDRRRARAQPARPTRRRLACQPDRPRHASSGPRQLAGVLRRLTPRSRSAQPLRCGVVSAWRRAASRVVTNLVVNARDAVEPGGEIAVRVDSRERDGGASLAITVADNGCGIPEAVLDRMFEPYVTTKRNGNGLGLAASHCIVRGWGGDIGVA
ncbi:MAG: ATP-binding protein, partial [Actinobacteria bacterium]|nr:ATP-binding protein [Actinomycetota bacterium]